ncbi:hypothetical protein CTI12_AA377690 [Artemisia annua]|uniref:Uncharacterized protein n=1 Tax=Artemisia annua TaxID=35608 RepID=A0A2U1MH52_ARTAN|nr:hypothetical protein CTI12_AA377690 [Artemisia annua]
MDRMLAIDGIELIGINNRNLVTNKVTTNTERYIDTPGFFTTYSSHDSSNASSYTASPMQSYRNRRKIDNFDGKGYLYFLKKNNVVLIKSSSMAFVSDQRNVVQDHEKTDEELLGRALSAMSRLGENERMLSDPTWFRRSEDHERAIMELPGEYVHTNRG